MKAPQSKAKQSSADAAENPEGSAGSPPASCCELEPAPGAAPEGESPEHDLDDPQYFLNRELTWLAFNWRVLHEAEDPRTPLLERVKFLAIVASNLDEFFMKRIGGLKQQVGAGVRGAHRRRAHARSSRSRSATRRSGALYKRKGELLDELIPLLREQGIVLTEVDELDAEQQASLREHYRRNIYPLVTPQAMDPAHPFPFVSNLSLNLLVTLHHPKDQDLCLARVKVPVGEGIPRLVRVGDENTFVMLEDVMAHNLDLLFPGMEIDGCELFRVTRNANTERDEEQADDLLALIEAELRERKFAPIVRLQVAHGIDPAASRDARGGARPRRGIGRLRGRRPARHGGPDGDREPRHPGAPRPPAPPRRQPRARQRAEHLPHHSRRPDRSCCTTPTSPSARPWSASCARPARTPRCGRSR